MARPDPINIVQETGHYIYWNRKTGTLQCGANSPCNKQAIFIQIPVGRTSSVVKFELQCARRCLGIDQDGKFVLEGQSRPGIVTHFQWNDPDSAWKRISVILNGKKLFWKVKEDGTVSINEDHSDLFSTEITPCEHTESPSLRG